MFGSIFYNFWAALLSFAVYFVWSIQNPFAYPLFTIGISFVAGIIGFIAMYFVRYFIGYVMYTPESLAYSEIEETQNDDVAVNENQNQFIPQSDRSTVEFEEDNTEEIAKVVRTMLHGKDEAVSS